MPRNDQDFNERLQTAAKAKQALLAKARAIAAANAEGATERLAQRLAVSEAREVRRREREAAKAAQAQREAEARAAAALAAQQAAEAERAAQEAEKNKAAIELAELRTRQKAGRDAKYAARQARRESRRA